MLGINHLDALICHRLTGHADKLLNKMNNMEKERPKHLLPKYAMGPEMRHRMKMMRRMDPELMHMYMEEVLNGGGVQRIELSTWHIYLRSTPSHFDSVEIMLL